MKFDGDALAVAALTSVICACGSSQTTTSTPAAATGHDEAALVVPAQFEIHGHRGARGREPENTIEGMLAAVGYGVDVLETDLLLTKDGVVVLHHDEALNPDTTRDQTGQWLPARGPTIVSLTAEELARYDVGRLRPGSEYAARFPHQRARDGVRIPTLAAAFEAIEQAAPGRVRWNLEIKRDPPERVAPLQAAVDATLAVVRAKGLEGRVMIQSFDWQVVRYVQQVAPGIPTECLSEPKRDSGPLPEAVIAEKCPYWAPKFDALTREQVDAAHRSGLKVVPWTVNEPADLRRVVGLGVDGLITDYPDRIRHE